MFETKPGDAKVHYYDHGALKYIEGHGIFELIEGHYMYEFYWDDEDYIYKYATKISEEEALKCYVDRYGDAKEFYKHYYRRDEINISI